MTDSRSELMALADKLRHADVQRFPWLSFAHDVADDLTRLAASQPDREMVARAIYEVGRKAIEPALGMKLCEYEDLGPRDLKLHRDYADAAILLLLVGGDQKKLNSDCQHQTEQSGKQPSAPLHIALHEDRIEKLDHVFYLRWTSGPDYERVFLCIEDGEPDMHDLATLNYKQARVFAEAYRAAQHATEAPQRWRHIKRGSEYTLVGNAQVQAEDPLTDYEIVVVYKGPGGLWVRRKSEFYDGRFEAVAETDSRDSSECSPREVFADPNPAPPAGGR